MPWTVPAGGWKFIAWCAARVEEQRQAGRRSGSDREPPSRTRPQVLGVLDDADHPQRPAVDRPGRADLQVERRRDRRGHRRLAGTDRVAAGDQAQHRLAEDAVRVLGAQIDRSDRSRHRHALVGDRFGGAEAAAGRRPGRRRRRSPRDRLMSSRASAVPNTPWSVPCDVDDEPEADGGRSDRDDRAARGSGPAGAIRGAAAARPSGGSPGGPALRRASVPRCGDRWWRRCEGGAHRAGSASSSDSGPFARAV